MPTPTIPRYDTGGFAHLPHLLASAFAGQGSPVLDDAGLAGPFENVVFLLVDAFGWRFFEQFADSYPFLRRLAAGHLARLTSQFPSTTAAHLTTLGSGKEVGQHGVFEWQYYEPQLDAMIVPLLFSFAGDTVPETLRATGVEPGRLLPEMAFFGSLAQHGIQPHVFLPEIYAHSSYSRTLTQNTTSIPYKTLPEALVNLRRLLLEAPAPPSPRLFFLYIDEIDAICHRYGPGSPYLAAEVDALFTQLERIFWSGLEGHAGKTLLLLTADHGQIEVNPAATIYLNLSPHFARLQPLLAQNRRGQTLTPGGSARDVFLYTRPGLADEAAAVIETIVAGRADVRKTAELIAGGYFGPAPVSPRLNERMSDLVILPHPGEAVWWYEKDRFEQKFYGHHGGLTPQELEIPLLLYRLS
ncbi:MAG: alkaline phosphatase family protein [Caldilineales bacterium]|nr:alkaline phosphatase family protein [Caldilineales bacterium]MCW5856998.1 alkaline phosphatase family protein [Caldilineales bacterium]